MSSLASLPPGPFRCSEEEVIKYGRLAIKGKTQKYPGYPKYPARPLFHTPSIAQHSWLMAILCFALPRDKIPGLDIAYCIQLSVVYGMKLVDVELCQNNPAEKLLEELDQCKSLDSQIVVEVDKIAMILLTSLDSDSGTKHYDSIMRSLVLLDEWAKEITYMPPIDQVPATTTEPKSGEWPLHEELLKRVHLQHPGSSKSLPVFVRTAVNLLTVKRQGWLDKKIDEKTEVESVADHSWSMAVICFLIREDGMVKVQDAVRGCVVHDLAESLVGDITYKDGVDREEKLRREGSTIDFLQSQLPEDAPLKASWEEFEAAKTRAAEIAKDLDKVDLAFQASDYEERTGVKLHEFFDSAQRAKLCGCLIEKIIEQKKTQFEALDDRTRRGLDDYYGNKGI